LPHFEEKPIILGYTNDETHKHHFDSFSPAQGFSPSSKPFHPHPSAEGNSILGQVWKNTAYSNMEQCERERHRERLRERHGERGRTKLGVDKGERESMAMDREIHFPVVS
jgi:hypothetical protein